MIAFGAPSLLASREHWSRFLVACALSLALHAVLLGVPAREPGSTPPAVSSISARLEPALDSEPRHEIAVPGKIDLPVTSRAERAERKPTATTAAPQREAGPAVTAPPAASVGGLELSARRDPTYYPVRLLDVYPQPLAPLKLAHADAAAAGRFNGRLVLQMLIDEFGVVDDISVVEARPAGLLDEGALAPLRAVRFQPGQKQGLPVKSRVLLEFSYSGREAR